MNDSQFKKLNKPPLCTNDPVMTVVPKDKYHELVNIVRQKARDRGEEYDAGCPKRHTCVGPCTGRPVIDYVKELNPYIAKIKHLISTDGMIYLQGCGTCKIAKTCKSTCHQITDYMDRNKNKDDFVSKLEPMPISMDQALSTWVSDDAEPQTGVLSELIARYGSIQATIEHLPWGAINDKRQRLIRMYIFEGKDFRASSKELGYSNGNVARNEFYRALSALSKFATVRYFIEEHRDEISDIDYELLQLRYYKFLGVAEISTMLNVPVGTIRSKLFRFLKKSGVKYSSYVNKSKIIPSSIF